MKVAVLASGSNGNATYIETKNHKILVDDGIAFKTLMCRMQQAGFDVSNIDTFFLTHEHFDHVNGLKVLAKKVKMECYMSQGTYNGLNIETKEALKNQEVHLVKGDDVVVLDECTVTILNTHHDVREPNGFVFEEAQKKLVYITDTGYVDKAYFPIISNAEMYVMESNYDVELLWTSGRPFELKKRIDGDHGHMSNEASAVLLSNVMGDKTEYVVRAHISDDCNYYHAPQLIAAAHQRVYDEYGISTEHISFSNGNRNGITGVYEI